MKAESSKPVADVWIRRVGSAALLALAGCLIGVGIILYV